MSKPLSGVVVDDTQDVQARLEISLLKERIKALEEAVLAQEATIERLKRLVGCLR